MIDFKDLPAALTAPIGDLAAGTAFIDALVEAELDWHFEDDAVDCLHETNPRVDREAAELLNLQRDALYELDWEQLGHECPIGYLLEVHDRRGTFG